MIPRVLGLLVLVGLYASAAHSGTIHGSVFTAAHEDSILSDAPVTLIFRDAQGELQRIETETDAGGHFHFLGVSSDTSIQYVLGVDYLGQEFLGSPMQFSPGEEDVTFNLLISRPGSEGGGLPSGHPALDGQPMTGRPAVQKPLHTILITLWIVVLFIGIAILMRRGPSDRAGTVPSPRARELIHDIASLDNRHSEGIMGDEEYRKVRASLLERLRGLMGKGEKS